MASSERRPLAVGDKAPDVSLAMHDGRVVRLADFIGDKTVVIFFYPKDNTPLCTKEACAFRDSYARFVEAGCEVIGVSSDSFASHGRFAERHRLPYPLASDPDGGLRKAFGVAKTFGIFPGRATYVIDRQGVVRMVFSAQMASEEHVRKALAAVSGG